MLNNADIAVAKLPGLVSIVIPCCGMLEYTKLSVPSILKHSRPPFELIFIDIGSLDGTAEYLAGLKTGLEDKIHMQVVRTPTDLGLREACREALAETRGEFVVLLNNDCIVTNSWLNQLTGLVSFTAANGLAGPMSNMAPMAQLVDAVPYRACSMFGKNPANLGGSLIDVAAVERFAESHKNEHKGKWLHAERLGGFCLLVKREVLDKIGPGLEQWSDLGLFDTDILSAKARQLGYSPAVCRDLFVHHFGTRTCAHGPPAARSGTAAVSA
jgi:O-antigen biosynthesis protein